MDANTWATREARYTKKFEAGRKYIPGIFNGITLPTNIEQIPLLGFARNANVKTLSGGRIMTSAALLADLTAEIGQMRIAQAAIPEQYPIGRASCRERVGESG